MDFHKDYDVVVAGAGVAGVAAALAAARRGCSVALIEKQALIGGLATSGLVYVYLPLCDGNGTQVTFGIAEELLRCSLTYGPFDLSERWGGTAGAGFDRFMCHFAPAGLTIAMDGALNEAGVDLWLETLLCAVETSAEKVTAIEVENVSGRGRIGAKCFVDTTGDAGIVRRAGGEFVTSENYKTPWVMENSPDTRQYHLVDSVHIKVFGAWRDEFLAGYPLDGKSVTAFTRDTWQTLRDYYDRSYRDGFSDRHHLFPVHLPAMPQFRKIARIKGRVSLSDDQHGTYAADSIGLYADWRKSGHVWETPYGTLLPQKIRGVLVAGRSMSTEGDAWEVYRVIPAAVMSGEAAGVAAALAAEHKCEPGELNVADVQDALRPNGIKFHLAEVGL
ncbi:MAG: FAD-dependent oxidoreductase [Lentisphaerae bacterium]|jgi:hypothetical protein|nr:FAD-dependent oxidoreductase [Lentisphaerota bacterium]MBT4819533.1 FAD-dependent oxidoreductase [Lentisphaerota bacterium]MBT5612544.1 FAD-dependent oxidoreductase [Lentisphaerota bacterium]MBT7061339.1 FAD-dependent oxidoreductase [Lentisphaerota bacterium]MBT7840480.1 FAD-dependent oxidoreductase [Lentisphaerota bacterium]